MQIFAKTLTRKVVALEMESSGTMGANGPVRHVRSLHVKIMSGRLHLVRPVHMVHSKRSLLGPGCQRALFRKPQRIIDGEDDYRRCRLNQIISPERHNPFVDGEKTSDPLVRTYGDIMREEALKREKEETLKAVSKKKKEEEEAAKATPPQQQQRRYRRNWINLLNNN
ncbi:hypothetical protein V8G54_033834 [Vigna mungo]|uniref:Uncharacterized protein n=1 Tax=Vigna mungo TaxID=3915 RepID=A0AAQ3MPP7_VIGMU